ncbi:hypothetical protein GSI_11696 [Ganoderma sinense ZZ0214-1]|uniref:Uncharacterized protein n=1 Tax=Ganoderma sinense ZZ0214-1 TaxID=1077348 RepID=A0A2G8RWQ4_9APHY|nr:hypothetical protein GSI_11696 [Ganoderma sinense ZZ0214-1]
MVAYVPPEPFNLDVACAILLQFAMFITAYFVRFIRKLLCYRDEPAPGLPHWPARSTKPTHSTSPSLSIASQTSRTMMMTLWKA